VIAIGMARDRIRATVQFSHLRRSLDVRERAVVVGAGIGGLTAAMALSRGGYEVVVVERDDTPMPDDVEGAFAWDRRGAPQVRHTHGFPALIRCVLRDRFPDVLDALRDAGVRELSIFPPVVPPGTPGHEQDEEDLQVLACRRTTLEWVLRRCALAEPAVTFRVGVGVDGLVGSLGSGAMPRLDVGGVRLADGTTVDADVVVATTGRRGDVPGWFAAHGVDVPETETPTGTMYLSRWYRGVDLPLGFLGGRRAGIGFVVAGADHGHYSVTLAVPTTDAELRSHAMRSFEAVAGCFREVAPVLDAGGEAVTPVQTMGGLINRIRRFVHEDGSPRAHGFFAVGDAHTCTNPLYGRGSSLAVLQATMLADALAAHPGDPDAASRAYESASAERVEPWYDVSLGTDSGTAPRVRSGLGSQPGPSRTPTLDLQQLRRVAAGGDPHLAILVVRTLSLLVTPAEVFGDPAVLAAMQAIADAPRPQRPDYRPLTRDDLLVAGA
jgi:2-polyprenyl-6-methoxyphenol hydroxylase-like FAD-dependent oxidoreductase